MEGHERNFVSRVHQWKTQDHAADHPQGNEVSLSVLEELVWSYSSVENMHKIIYFSMKCLNRNMSRMWISKLSFSRSVMSSLITSRPSLQLDKTLMPNRCSPHSLWTPSQVQGLESKPSLSKNQTAFWGKRWVVEIFTLIKLSFVVLQICFKKLFDEQHNKLKWAGEEEEASFMGLIFIKLIH